MEAARDHDSAAPETATSARWPERLIELATTYRSASDEPTRDRALTEFWVLVHGALCRFLRSHGIAGVRDLGAEKALHLVERMRGGRWEPETALPAQVHTFVATVARNAVVDRTRRSSREELAVGTSEELASTSAAVALSDDVQPISPDRTRYAAALLACASKLVTRVRRAWFLRVFHELPTKAIAAHPEVGMKPASLDVTLARCRERMRRCMRSKGFDPTAMPAGTFAVLWEAMRR